MKNLRNYRFGALTLAAAFLLAGETAMSYEAPRYTVLYTDGEVEYREYDAYLVSETVVKASSYRAAGNEGFRRLFRYISGANRGSAEIAMTVPVAQAPAEKIAMTVPVAQAETDQGWTVSFMLPSSYTLENAPQPTDERVYVREVPARVMAVMRFSGRMTEGNFEAGEQELRAALAAMDVAVEGEAERAVYNGPFTLPFLRRNEVLIPVAGVPAPAGEVVRQARGGAGERAAAY